MTLSKIDLSDSLSISRISVGLWRLMEWKLSKDALADWVKACLELGISTFDHADIYGNYQCEAEFGAALAGKSYLRQKMELVTKCGIKLASRHQNHAYDTSAGHIIASVEQSLKNLRTDYLDLLLIHRPDPLMDADEVAAAFEELFDDGKVLNFGVSNFSNSQFTLLDSRLNEFDLVTNQVEFSVAHLAPLYDSTFDFLQMVGISPMIWSPLGGGSIFSGENEPLQLVLQQVALELEATIDQVALAWVLAHPVQGAPILGTGNLERIKSAVAAEALPLSRDQWFRILVAAQGHALP